MKYNLSVENIAALITLVLGTVTLASEKIRGFFLTKLSFRKSKAQIKKDTYFANDDILDKLKNRIDDLSQDYLGLLEENSETQKDNFKLKRDVNKLENNIKVLKGQCTNNCKIDV